MEESKAMEGEGFIRHVDDEVDVKVGTNSSSKNEKAREHENLEKRRFPWTGWFGWTRKKV